MYKPNPQISVICLLLILLFFSCEGDDPNSELKYPEPYKVNVINNYFNTKVEDPFFWLEDNSSKRTSEWINLENNITNRYLSKIPYRKKIEQRLSEIWNYPKQYEPLKKGDYYFYFKNNGLEDHDVLYYIKGDDSVEIELLNPNKFPDKNSVFLTHISISDDCKYLGYILSEAGSDWQEIYIKENKYT